MAHRRSYLLPSITDVDGSLQAYLFPSITYVYSWPYLLNNILHVDGRPLAFCIAYYYLCRRQTVALRIA